MQTNLIRDHTVLYAIAIHSETTASALIFDFVSMKTDAKLQVRRGLRQNTVFNRCLNCPKSEGVLRGSAANAFFCF